MDFQLSLGSQGVGPEAFTRLSGDLTSSVLRVGVPAGDFSGSKNLTKLGF